MKPKLADVARHAGVSLATADRVINNRSGVRDITRQKVLCAVDELGYQPDPNATNLARSEVRNISIILPTGELSIYQAVLKHWPQIKRVARYDRVELQLMPYSPEVEGDITQCIDQAEKTSRGIILAVSDCPAIRERAKSLSEAGIVVHTVLTGLASGAARRYVGVDNYKMGRAVAYFFKLLTHAHPGGILTRQHEEGVLAWKLLVDGFKDYLAEQDWSARLIPDETDGANTNNPLALEELPDEELQQVSDEKEKVIAILHVGEIGLREFLSDLSRHESDRPKIIVISVDMTAELVDALKMDRVDVIFYLDVVRIMERAIIGMIDELILMNSEMDDVEPDSEYLDVKIYVKENLPEWCIKIWEDVQQG